MTASSPAGQRRVRRAALQALYQFDALADPDMDMVRVSLDGASGDEREHEDAFALALAAWTDRDRSDELVRTVAPQWPTHRQASIDRAILRLACWEMLGRDVPPRVVIDEAIELAREFSTEQSPSFVNGVLDAVMRHTGLATAADGDGDGDGATGDEALGDAAAAAAPAASDTDAARDTRDHGDQRD